MIRVIYFKKITLKLVLRSIVRFCSPGFFGKGLLTLSTFIQKKETFNFSQFFPLRSSPLSYLTPGTVINALIV